MPGQPAQFPDTTPQVQPQTQGAIKQQPQAPVIPQPSPPGMDRAVRGEISFDFDDADIFDVVRTIFGNVLRESYMIDPKVKGRINFRTVIPVPKKEVIPIMESLLKLNGAGILLDKGIYRILPLNEIPGTIPTVFVYPLQNSKATHVASMLQSMLTGSHPGSVKTAGTASTPSRASASVVTLGTGFLVASETRLIADGITNSLIILSTPNDYKFIEETVKKLDTAPRQVLIEVLIAEVDFFCNVLYLPSSFVKPSNIIIT
jgi:type II secretory pathway component GspD/PulD (secretin)